MQGLPGVRGMVEHRPGGEVASGFSSSECQCRSGLLRPWVRGSSDLLMEKWSGLLRDTSPL